MFARKKKEAEFPKGQIFTLYEYTDAWGHSTSVELLKGYATKYEDMFLDAEPIEWVEVDEEILCGNINGRPVYTIAPLRLLENEKND